VNGLARHESDSAWLIVNAVTLPKLLFLGTAFVVAQGVRRVRRIDGDVGELIGHAGIALLLGVEFYRWGAASDRVDPQLSQALLAGVWALQACGLIWYGLMSRERFRRIAGFVLFGATVVQIIVIAVEANLPVEMQVLSFLGSGLLLIAASWFYAKYSSIFLVEAEHESEHLRPRN
jgi:uncharacterized membrane protein